MMPLMYAIYAALGGRTRVANYLHASRHGRAKTRMVSPGKVRNNKQKLAMGASDLQLSTTPQVGQTRENTALNQHREQHQLHGWAETVKTIRRHMNTGPPCKTIGNKNYYSTQTKLLL